MLLCLKASKCLILRCKYQWCNSSLLTFHFNQSSIMAIKNPLIRNNQDLSRNSTRVLAHLQEWIMLLEFKTKVHQDRMRVLRWTKILSLKTLLKILGPQCLVQWIGSWISTLLFMKDKKKKSKIYRKSFLIKLRKRNLSKKKKNEEELVKSNIMKPS